MKLRILILVLVAAVGATATERPVRAQQDKLAQTGMKFLSVSVDPRAAALGDAVTAVEGGSSMLFYNPAAMARQQGAVDLLFGQTQWIAEINYSLGSIAFSPGNLGVFGFTFVAVDFGDLEETIRFNNDQGFLDLGTFSPSAWSLGFGYARALSDRFAVGAHAKWANQDLGSSVVAIADDDTYERTDNVQGVMAYDFGVLYRTGFRSLNFAVSARNFAREIAYTEESFQLPLTLKIGVAMNLMDLTSANPRTHALLLAIDAENPRDYSEQVKAGAEYVFLRSFALRVGYAYPTDIQGLSFGLGLRQALRGFGFAADYSYTDFDVFSNVHRLTFRFSL